MYKLAGLGPATAVATEIRYLAEAVLRPGRGDPRPGRGDARPGRD